MRNILILVILLSPSICYSLTLNEIHPKSGLINIGLSQLNLKGNIKKVSIDGYSKIKRRNHIFIKRQPTIIYEFSNNGNITSSFINKKNSTKQTYTYENNLIKNYVTYSKKHNDEKFIKYTNLDYHYKNGKIFGIISSRNNINSCIKYKHSKSTIESIDCKSKDKVIYTYFDNNSLKSIHRIPKLFDETINTYSYEKNITHVENKINDNTVSNKRIKKDVNGNIIEITTIFSNPNNSMSIFPNDHLQNKVIFDILNYDKYGNPLSILVSSIASYKDKEKNKKYERKEIITYEYY